MNLTWKKSVPHFGPVVNKLFLGKVHVGSFYQQMHGVWFAASCRLTGSKSSLETEDDARVWVEQSVRECVADAGLTGGDNDPQ